MGNINSPLWLCLKSNINTKVKIRFLVILIARVIAAKEMESTSSHMKEMRARMRTAARNIARPHRPPPIRKRESTVTAATVNSSVTEGYENNLTTFLTNC